MCVEVELCPTRVTLPWDAERLTITVLAGRGVERTTRAVRAVLIELDALQPPLGAVCWCGDVVDIPAIVRRGVVQMSEVVARGA